jgi:hypothetical protein
MTAEATKPRGRAPQHHLVMALRRLSDIESGPRFRSFDRARQIYELNAANGTILEMSAADIPAYLSGCADAATTFVQTPSDADPLSQLATTYVQLHAHANSRTLPTSTRLLPYLQGTSDAAQSLQNLSTTKRRTTAAIFAEAARQALGQTTT